MRRVMVSISAVGAKGDKGKRLDTVKAPTKKTFTSPKYLSPSATAKKLAKGLKEEEKKALKKFNPQYEGLSGRYLVSELPAKNVPFESLCKKKVLTRTKDTSGIGKDGGSYYKLTELGQEVWCATYPELAQKILKRLQKNVDSHNRAIEKVEKNKAATTKKHEQNVKKLKKLHDKYGKLDLAEVKNYLSLLNIYPDMKVPKMPKSESRVGKKD